MFYYLSLPFVSLLDFFDRGGPVIFILFIVAIIMITLLVERLIFFVNDLKKLSDERVLEVKECHSSNRWVQNKIKLMNISILNSESSRNLLMIQGLIALCPLLGLLGTVTGMIEVFDVMSVSGSGNARSMASGASKATIPTMAGMVGALSGVFLVTILNQKVTSEADDLEDSLGSDE